MKGYVPDIALSTLVECLPEKRLAARSASFNDTTPFGLSLSKRCPSIEGPRQPFDKLRANG
jgi:hypothetical protein